MAGLDTGGTPAPARVGPVSVPDKGWTGNIMAEVGGVVEQKNIDAIVSQSVTRYNADVESVPPDMRDKLIFVDPVDDSSLSK